MSKKEGTRNERRDWLGNPELESMSLLVWRATMNSSWRKAASKAARQRGHNGALRYLREARIFTTGDPKKSKWQPKTLEVPRGHWLDRTPSPKAPCIDCGTDTRRTYNGYHQCQTCANAIKRHGSRLNLEQARLVREAVVQQRLEEYEGKPARAAQEATPMATKESAVAALDTGIDAANRELFEVGQAAYDDAKNGPVGQAVAMLKKGSKNVSAA